RARDGGTIARLRPDRNQLYVDKEATMANAEQTFRAKAPGIMAKLLRDFPIAPEDAAAILGNLGHESLGFTAMQEFRPVVAGSRGGWGWAQWTGPRRRAFEAYCARTGKDPAS